MTSRSMTPLLRHLREITNPARASGVADSELLERFVRQRDEIAFELLVWRHQRMVLGVCRRVLLDAQEAEDAFQAAFLALIQRAATVCRYRSVGGWLHNVAYHVALRARKRSARQATAELSDADIERCHDPAEAASRREIATLLDEEVSRLPEKYRLPVVLCYLEGQTYQEAGRQLGVPVGTLSARLTRGRSLLRSRLARRGIGVSGALLAVLLCEQASSAAAGATLVKAAAALARGQIPIATSASIAALAESALGSMVVSKVKIATAVVLAGCLLAGMGLLIPAAVAPPSSPESAPSPPAAAAEKKKPPHVDRYGDPLPAGALFRFGSVRMRHDGGIRASALSADGKLLATSSGRSVVIWDLAAGKPLRRFDCARHWPYSYPGIAFSPDGKHLGYAHSNDLACLWDVSSGKEVLRLDGDKTNHWRLCRFTLDGKQLILNEDKQLNFWDVRARGAAHSLRIENVSLLSPDGGTWVRIETEAIQFGDVRTGAKAGRLSFATFYDGIENGFAFAPDGKTVAVVQRKKEIQVLDFPSGALRTSFRLPDSAKERVAGKFDCWGYRVCFSADGRTLLLGTRGGFVHRWDLRTNQEMPALKKHFGPVIGMHVLPDKRSIVTTGADGLIRRWDWRTGRELSEAKGYVGRTYAAFSPDGRFIAVADVRGRLDLWDARGGRPVRALQRQGPSVTKLAFAPDGESLVAAEADHTVRAWSIPASEERTILRLEDKQDLSYVKNLLFSPDGRRLLIADRNYRACLWELTSGEMGWRGGFGEAAFSPDGTSVVTAFGGPCLNVLDAGNGKPRLQLRLNNNAPENFGIVSAIASSPDGRRLAVGLHGGDVYLCDAHTGAEIKRFQAVDYPQGRHAAMLRDRVARADGLAFSADSRWLCTSGSDGSVRLWEVVTGQEVLRLRGHEGEVSQVAFGADSRTVLSCGEDAQAYLWSLRPPTGKEAKPSLDSLWADLAGEPAKAYRATWALSEVEGAAAFLRGKLVPVKPVPEERLQKLIADLESESFAVREAAAKALDQLDVVAAPAMRKTLAARPPLETRKRLEAILKRVEAKTLTAEELRTWRAIDVLERLGTTEAREVLKMLAAGAPGALPTTAARAALKRLR